MTRDLSGMSPGPSCILLVARHLRRVFARPKLIDSRAARKGLVTAFSSSSRRRYCQSHRRDAIELTLRVRLVREVQIILKRVLLAIVFVTSSRCCRERGQDDHRLSFHCFSPYGSTPHGQAACQSTTSATVS